MAPNNVYAWGLGKNGQLGTQDSSPVPVAIAKGSSVLTSVAAGNLFTLVITDAGELYAVGRNRNHRLGIGQDAEADYSSPIPVKGALEGQRVVKAAGGGAHGCAISDNGIAYIWGHKKACGSDSDITTPIAVAGLPSSPIIDVSCGTNFTLFLTEQGQVYALGAGTNGVLGSGGSGDARVPQLVSGLDNVNIVNISAGACHCGAVSDSGAVYMWGHGGDGELGSGKRLPKPRVLPKVVTTIEGAVQVSCSKGSHHKHTLVRCSNGSVYSFGSGYKGKLGHNGDEDVLTPTPISALTNAAHVSAGGIHSAAVLSDGHCVTWGCGSDGRLGHPESANHRYLFKEWLPRPVEALNKRIATLVSCSYYHTTVHVQ